MKLFGNRHSGGDHASARTDDAEIDVTEVRSDGDAEAAETAGTDAAKKKKALRRACIIAGAIVLALGAVVSAYFIWERPPVIAPANTEAPGPTGAISTARPTDGLSAPGSESDGNGEIEDDTGALVLPMTAGRKDGVYTFLLVGLDQISNSTDTIIVASFDTKEHTISCTSIPRDTLINISWITPKKINTVYSGYINSGGDGVEGLKTHIRKLLGFDVDCYVVVDLVAVEEAVDVIGGVWFDVPQDMRYWDPTQNLAINISAGYQLLNGSDAVKLCRFRADYADADLGRIKVQQAFLRALADQLISANSIAHLGELIDIVTERVDTDLDAANIAWLARQFLACSMDGITFQTMPISPASTGINDVSFVGVDVNAWLEMVNASINPYEEDVALANMDLLTFGYGGQFVGTNNPNGIAGGYGSFFCQRCTAATGRTIYHAPGAHLSFETPTPETPADGGEMGGEPVTEEPPAGGEAPAPAPEDGGE